MYVRCISLSNCNITNQPRMDVRQNIKENMIRTTKKIKLIKKRLLLVKFLLLFYGKV